MADESVDTFHVEFPDGEIMAFDGQVLMGPGLQATCTVVSEVRVGSIYDKEGAD